MKFQITKDQLLSQGRDYIAIIFGLFLLSLGYTAFVLPERVVTGGVAGLSTIVYLASDKLISPSITIYGINLLLLLIAFRTVGLQFVVRTIIGASIFSGMVAVMVPLFPTPLVEQQPFMNVIIGAVICGTGIGITYGHNGSSGGTDVVAAMVNRHSNISFGRMMLYCDFCIIMGSYFLFHEVDKILFGFVFLVINSVSADMVLNKRNQGVQFLIFSERWQDIANAINNDVRRGCTLLHGTGWYSKHDVKLLLVVCRKYESIDIQRVIKAIDPNAFISMTNTSNVFGSGFDSMKVKLKKYQPKLRDENSDLLDTANFAAPEDPQGKDKAE